MLTLMKRALEPSSSCPDKIMYMTSVGLYQSLCSVPDNSAMVMDQIKDLLTSSNTRLQGLQILEIALQQNSDVYMKANWSEIIYEILKEDGAYILKEHACKIFCMLVPYMAKNPTANPAESKKLITDLFPVFLKEVVENVEWIEASCKCIHTCLKFFPRALESHRDPLLRIILKQVSCSVSSKTFEVYADWFCEMPNFVVRDKSYEDLWNNQYLTTLNTMQQLLKFFFNSFTNDLHTDVKFSELELYTFEDDNESKDNIFPIYMKAIRRFINLSKCLAKMLSTKSKSNVTIPIRTTLLCLTNLFQPPENMKSNIEFQTISSNLAQMQIAALVIIEAVILNFNLIPESFIISQIMSHALKSSRTAISTETVSQLRHAVWKLMNKWLSLYGATVSADIAQHYEIIGELLNDISIEEKESSQTSSIQEHHKSKKNVCMSSGKKSYCINKNYHLMCKEALKVLESLIYSGAPYMNKKVLQEINNKVVQVLYAIHPSCMSFPFPYDDDSCRKNIYSVLLSIVVVSKPDQKESVQFATGIFKNALKDPSIKVTRLCHRAAATCRLFLHPKRPPPVYLGDKQRRSNISSAIARFPEWSSEDYVPNLPIETVSEASENVPPRVVRSFHNPNESEINTEEYMEVEQHYPEQTTESQCNGEEISEIQSSSQCQDDVESEDEDEEDDDERSYGEEDMNQEEIQPESMYIPSTSKLQGLNPIHISSETVQTVVDPEYEELRPCAKTEDSIVDSSNKNVHLNGVRSIVPDEDVPSSSTQTTVANENGIYGLEDEDLEEEEGEEDEDEETVSFPAEKRVPDFYDPSVEGQKLDTDEVNEELLNDERENSRSPTLSEMKADFCCNDVEDVRS